MGFVKTLLGVLFVPGFDPRKKPRLKVMGADDVPDNVIDFNEHRQKDLKDRIDALASMESCDRRVEEIIRMVKEIEIHYLSKETGMGILGVTRKLQRCLSETENPPTSMWDLGIRLNELLNIDEINFLAEMEHFYGEDRCNQWLVKVMVSTGKYKTDDGETVQLAT